LSQKVRSLLPQQIKAQLAKRDKLRFIEQL